MNRIIGLIVMAAISLTTISAAAQSSQYCPNCGRQVSRPVYQNAAKLYQSNTSYQNARSRYTTSGYSPRSYSSPSSNVYRAQSVSSSQPVLVASWGSGEALQAARTSALYRARNRISGHTGFDSGRKAGVGYSYGMSSNTPRTCYWSERNAGSYAAYRVGDKVFSTLIFPR